MGRGEAAPQRAYWGQEIPERRVHAVPRVLGTPLVWTGSKRERREGGRAAKSWAKGETKWRRGKGTHPKEEAGRRTKMGAGS